MPRKYDNNFKSMVVNLIINEKHSTSLTAKQFKIPLKTVENWITAYNKNKHIFDDNYKSQAQLIKELEQKLAYEKRNNEILKKTISLLAKKD